MDNWISVNDNPPKIGERVLIVSNSTNNVLEGVRYKHNHFNRFGCSIESDSWQPLPEPPETE